MSEDNMDIKLLEMKVEPEESSNDLEEIEDQSYEEINLPSPSPSPMMPQLRVLSPSELMQCTINEDVQLYEDVQNELVQNDEFNEDLDVPTTSTFGNRLRVVSTNFLMAQGAANAEANRNAPAKRALAPSEQEEEGEEEEAGPSRKIARVRPYIPSDKDDSSHDSDCFIVED